MPQSIYDNGGMIGATLDFGDTSKYEIGTTTGPATITHVESSGTGQTITGTTLSLPNDLQPGDLVIVGTASDGEAYGEEISDPPGYTFGQERAFGVNAVWWYKFMGATPDTQIAGLLNEARTTHFYSVFRGVDQVSPIVSTATPSTSSSGMPNPPSLSTTADNMVLAIGFLDDDNIASSVTAPSGYTLSASSNATNGGASVMLAYKTSAGGTENPGVFGGSGSDSWVGMTVQLKQGVTEVPIFGNQKNSGIWSLSSVLESLGTTAGIEFVGAATGSTSIDLTSLSGGSRSAAQAGDLVLVVSGQGIDTAGTNNISVSGFTTIANLVSNPAGANGDDLYMDVAYKISTGDTSVSIASTVASIAYVFSGVSSSNPIDVTTTTATNFIMDPTPPSITPTTAGAYIVSCVGIGSDSDDGIFSNSTLSGTVSNNGSRTHVGIAYYDAWTSGAYTPTGWSTDDPDSTGSGAAVTIALRPA